MNAVVASLVAVFAKGYGGEPLPLLDFMGIAWAWGIADHATHALDALDVSAFGLRKLGFVL